MSRDLLGCLAHPNLLHCARQGYKFMRHLMLCRLTESAEIDDVVDCRQTK